MAKPTRLIVRKATVLDGAVPWKNQNVNDTYRGTILGPHNETARAYLKDLDARQLANELLAAALGITAGLPIPQPYLAFVERGLLPVSKFPMPDGTGHIVYASADVHSQTVAQVINVEGPASELLAKHLGKWEQLGAAYTFDTWIANVDRHMNNLLLSGSGGVTLIDHGHSFTGPAWAPTDLHPSAPYVNRLAQWLTPALSPEQRSRAAARITDLFRALDINEVPSISAANFVDDLLGRDAAPLHAFLRERVGHTARLSADALGVLV
ncbi:MAG TPA: HipA family kinase [Allosphingosinicella sp.]|jgi:hypothetical protein